MAQANVTPGMAAPRDNGVEWSGGVRTDIFVLVLLCLLPLLPESLVVLYKVDKFAHLVPHVYTLEI